MTIFNAGECTYSDILGPAMKITDIDDAKQYFESYVEYLIPYVIENNENATDDYIYTESVNIAKQNLAYYAGYYDNETRKRVENIFNCSHPIFGSIKDIEEMSVESAFELGKKFAVKNIRKVKLKKLNNNENNVIK